MQLRELKKEDAPLMLEWMHDKNIVENLYTDFESRTLEDCESFIKNSAADRENMHLAIASDEDEYMGTVSLKHIDMQKLTAEFAITVRSAALGKGYSWFAMTEILDRAFSEVGLNAVYWCVSYDNARAIRFYDKHGFNQVVDISDDILARYEGVSNLKWYSILKGDDYRNTALSRGEVAGCKIIKIKTVPTPEAGELSFFEGTTDMDFSIKRIYYISKVPEGVRRGFHAHKELKQLLFCPYGRIQMILDNGLVREEITLDDPSIGLIIDRPVWREMLWLEKNSVLCVAASEYYDPDDYIRDYVEYKKMIDGGTL